MVLPHRHAQLLSRHGSHDKKDMPSNKIMGKKSKVSPKQISMSNTSLLNSDISAIRRDGENVKHTSSPSKAKERTYADGTLEGNPNHFTPGNPTMQPESPGSLESVNRSGQQVPKARDG